MRGNSIDVFCAGFACWDLVFFTNTHPSANEKLSAKSFLQGPGGPALTAAGAIASLGGNSAFCGYLGNDTFGEDCSKILERLEVKTSDLLWNAAPTPLATVYVKPNGIRSVINYKGNEPNLPLSSIDHSLATAKAILIDPHWPQLATYIVERSQHFQIPSIIDAGSLTTDSDRLAKQVDYCVCSEDFAKSVTHQTQPNKILTALKEKYKKGVVTLGERGCFWWDEKSEDHISALPINAVDTTGAGDVFHGAFALKIARGHSIAEAAHFATHAATASCLKAGSLKGIPTLNDIDHLLKTPM